MVDLNIKKYLPNWLLYTLRTIKRNTFTKLVKSQYSKKMVHKNNKCLELIKGKYKIKVIFLAIHESVWKVDTVFKEMLKDPFFEPMIVVCPYITYGPERMHEDMELAYQFFSQKKYPVLNALDVKTEKWVNLDDLEPDLIFFTNPHNLTKPMYYHQAYEKYLSCYVPYHHEVVKYDNDQGQYNQDFHNAMWFIFSPHECSKETFVKKGALKGKNVVVTGYPTCENYSSGVSKDNLVWKKSNLIKVIWAPHHTIDSPELPYSNFLKYAELFIELARSYKDTLQWSFKPHPILKSKLYLHKDWGEMKTDEFYNFWKNSEYTQLDEGEYEELFKQSDAMIHDSSSFLAEYLYLKKPVLYLLGNEKQINFYNSFGIEALDASYIAKDWLDIKKFIGNLIAKTIKIKPAHVAFIKRQIMPYQSDSKPSVEIIKIIKNKINRV